MLTVRKERVRDRLFDQRIALTMPIESGSAGAPIFRGIPGESGSQPLSSAYNEQPWLGDAFSQFTGNPAMLPADTHEMVAMVAPRGLFIMENPSIDRLAARSGSIAALGGAEVYKALGVGSNITYWSDVQNGTHCANRPEWTTPLRENIQKFLLKTGNAPGTFRISSRKAGNLADWRDWQTPTLTDGPTPSPTATPSPSASPSSPPPGGTCTTTLRDGTRWADRFNTEITVSGAANWTGVVALTSPQQFSSARNATDSVSGSLATLRFNGNGNVFGITTLANGNFTRPQVRSCTAT